MIKKVQQALGVSAIAGALAYAALWLAYYQFYSQVQLTPEDVGIDKADLLSQAVVGPALLFLTLILTYGIWVTAMIVATIFNVRNMIRALPEFADLVRGGRESSPPPPGQRRWSLSEKLFLARRGGANVFKTAWRYTRYTAAVVGIGTFATLMIELAMHARNRGGDLIKGRPVENSYFTLLGMEIPLLEIRATPVEVSWAPFRQVANGALSSPCLLYLGDAGATAVLFDPPAGRIHRVPAAAVALQLEPADEIDPACVDESGTSE